MTFFVTLAVLIVAMHNKKYIRCRRKHRINSFRSDLPYHVFRDSTFRRDEERRRCTRADKNLPRWPMSVECVPSSGSTSRISRRDSRQNKMTIDIPRTPLLEDPQCF